MKPLRIAVLALGITAAGTAGAIAQSNSPGAPKRPMGAMPMHHQMSGIMAHGQAQQAAVPTDLGQAAFGAIQEIVEKLQADPQTDWSKVDIDPLLQHLIDMDEVTMRSIAQREKIENGLRLKVTGSGRTLAAVQRKRRTSARALNGRIPRRPNCPPHPACALC